MPRVSVCLISLALLMLSATSYAFNCTIQISKADCWRDYNVNIKMLDFITKTDMQRYKLDKKTDFVSKKFQCRPNQQLTFKARFSPKIWEGDEKKVFIANTVWNTPPKVEGPEPSWTMRLCYPFDFHNVPLPTSSDIANCHCHFPKDPDAK